MRPVLLDFNNHVRRCIACTATGDLKAGIQPTGGIFTALRGMANFLGANPNCGPVIVCVDDGIPEWRTQELPEYKAKRAENRKRLTKEQHEKIYSQLDLAEEMFRLLGCFTYRVEGCEADDAIAELVRTMRLRGQSPSPIIISGDRDLLQMVKYGAEVYDPRTKRCIQQTDFEEQVGVRPELYVLYRALIGDPSDGIGGIGGCGEKRAAALLHDLFDGEEIDDDVNQADWMVNALAVFLRQKKNPHEFEKNIIAGLKRIKSVMRAIDLTSVWRDFKHKRVLNKPSPDKEKFVEFCKRLQLRSVLGDMPANWSRFARANKSPHGII